VASSFARADLGDTLKLVAIETTLFIVCSKTFTTIETMTNAATARKTVVRRQIDSSTAGPIAAARKYGEG
jgi:glucose-6-phosphate isomerase